MTPRPSTGSREQVLERRPKGHSGRRRAISTGRWTWRDARRSVPRDELRLQIDLGNAIFGAAGLGSRRHLAGLDACPRTRRRARRRGRADFRAQRTGHLLEPGRGLPASIEIAERILGVAEAHDLRSGRLRGHCTLALNHLFLGDASLSLKHARHAIALYQPEDFHTVTYGFGTDQGVVAYSVAGATAWFVGRPDEGVALTEEAVQLGRMLGSPISELFARVFKGLLHHLAGRASWRVTRPWSCPEGARLSLWLPLGFGHMLDGVQRAIETPIPRAWRISRPGCRGRQGWRAERRPNRYGPPRRGPPGHQRPRGGAGGGASRPGDGRRARSALLQRGTAPPRGARGTRGRYAHRGNGRPFALGGRWGRTPGDRRASLCVRPATSPISTRRRRN